MNKAQNLLIAAKAVVSDPAKLISGTLVKNGCYCSLGAIGKASGMSDDDLDGVERYEDTFGQWPAVQALAKAITEYDAALGKHGRGYAEAGTASTARVFIFSDECANSEADGHARLMRIFDRALDLAV